jgi:hypothetical protein
VLDASQEEASVLDDSTAVAVVAITGTASREAATAGSVSKSKRDLRCMDLSPHFGKQTLGKSEWFYFSGSIRV